MQSVKDIVTNNRIVKAYLLPALVCIIIPIVLELTVFNFRHYQTRNYSPIMGMTYEVSSNLEMLDNSVYKILSVEEKPYIDVNISDVDIKDVYVDIWKKAEVSNTDRLQIHFRVSDQGNPMGYDMPAKPYLRGVWQSMYTYINLSGKCNSFRIYIDEGVEPEQLLRIDTIGFNLPVPFSLSKKRIALLSILLMLLYFLRPSADIYSMGLFDDIKYKKAIIVLVILGQAFLMWKVAHMNGACLNLIYDSQHQFEYMAEALAQGEVFLLKEPPKKLVEMDNPYSFQARLQNECQGEIMYDVAFYNGRYCVYFGIGPIVTVYLPYYLITGHHIHTVSVVFIMSVAVAIGWMFLLYEIAKKYFKEISFVLYLVCSVLFTASCGLTFVISRPDFYAVPMMMALASALTGLGFWFKSIQYNCEVTEYEIRPIYIALGSFFMAYVAACRPQFLIGSFLAVILFFKAVFKDRKLFSKNSIRESLGLTLPYVLIAAGVMYYNYARFGSVFDFGANYNLTFNDMTYRGFRIDRLLYATIGFLCIPDRVTNKFPYFFPADYVSRFQGIMTDDQLYGGLFYNHLYLSAILFIPKARKYIIDKGAFLLSIIMPVFALVVMVVDANMAGVLNRYFVDFSWLIIIAFYILLGYMFTDSSIKAYRPVIASVFYGLAILSFAHMFFMIYGGDINGLVNNGILDFERMSHMIEFWN